MIEPEKQAEKDKKRPFPELPPMDKDEAIASVMKIAQLDDKK